MANQHDIKKYLMEGDNPYFKQKNNNGKILMLSGVWGSGKTHFWKNEVEEDLIKDMDDKSYVFISLYGKDSIEELQNEIQQLSYNFSKDDSKNIISSTFSVFTKVASFIPKISFNAYGMGVKVDAEKTVEKLEKENIKQQIKQGVGRLKNGGIICFDDFERKSSKIDLNDLFGFITNLTEVFQTKTVIITNQEFFKENDSEVFSRIKEKSVNKFLLLDPTVDELFKTIYQSKIEYESLEQYKDDILKAIKITEEKNARIFIQVLDNCMEYKEFTTKENEIFMLVLITVLYVKFNLIFNMGDIFVGFSMGKKNCDNLPISLDILPHIIVNKMHYINNNINQISSIENFIDKLKNEVAKEYALKDGKNQKPADKLKDDYKYIDNNKDLIQQVYKYCYKSKYFEEKVLIEKLNKFVESGILLDSDV